MTSRISITNLSNTSLKISTAEEQGEGKKPVVSERLLMNREPQEFTITKDRVLVIAEAESADDGDNAKAAALDAAAKEPQRLSEQRNPQVTLGSQPHDPSKQPVAAPTPMANTPGVKQIPAQQGEIKTAETGKSPATTLAPGSTKPASTEAPMTNKDKAP